LFIFSGINLIILSGCNKGDENPVSLQEYFTISGKVTDDLGYGLSNIAVEIGSKSTHTQSDGSFSVANIILPYDITVYNGNFVETFNGVNSTSPMITIENSNTQTTYKTDITIIVPEAKNNQNTIATFYDNEGKFTGSKVLYNTNNGVMEYTWNLKPSVSGKMTVWICTVDNNGHIFSYDKYGEKPLTVTNGENGRIVFYDNDLGTNPADSSISGSVYLPSGYVIQSAIIGINRFPFASFLEYGYRYYNVTINNSYFSLPVPVLSGNIYSYYVNLEVRKPGNFGGYRKIVEIKPGNANQIGYDDFPNLISPQDNEQNVNYSTKFSFSKELPQGIYYVLFAYFKNGYFFNRLIYLNNESFQLSALSDTTYNIPDNTDCTWSVNKIAGYTSIDDYLSTPRGLNPKYTEILFSENRTFKTKFNKK
jgi:hypothetical protein